MNKDFTPSLLTDRQAIDSKAFDYKGWRERFVIVVLRVATLLGLGMLIVSFFTGTARENIIFTILFISLLAITFLRSPYWLRAGSLPALSFIIGLNALLTWGIWREAELFFLFSAVMASLLFDKREDIAVLALGTITILVVALLNSGGRLNLIAPTAPAIGIATWINFATDFLVLGVISISALNLFKREFSHLVDQMRVAFNALLMERSQLEERVQARTQELELKSNQLRSSTSIARTVTQIQDITELMNAMVHLTAERFGYYHVGIYLLDVNKKIAFLQAASSLAGKELIASGFRVEVDKRNAINLIVDQGKPYYIGDNSRSGFLKDDAFPRTRSRMILPLQVRGAIIGLIDLHSELEQVFSPEAAENFQSLADLVAVSIDNVRLLSETRALVSQLESFTSYQSKQSWQAYSGHRTSAYQFTPAGIRPIFPSTQDAKAAAERLNIPLLLRGQSIGSISLRRKDGAAGWTERERILIGKIAEQAALALENSRLVEEAQRNAQRDQLIASISSRVRETLDVDSVIRTAAVELRRIFDLKEAEVSVGILMPENAPAPTPPRKLTSRGTKPLN
jgi:GAF domain-containing protein